MGMPLKEALRRLCVEFGWSYAVFWRAIAATGSTPTHLIWEDGYYAQKSDMSGSQGVVQTSQIDRLTELSCQADNEVALLVNKMRASQVHVVGDGLIGEAASSGKYEWIVRDNLTGCGPFTSKGITEINSQLQAGIQTVAIIPVLPCGIIQLGSMQMLMEDTAFVNLVKGLFTQLNCGTGTLQSDTTQNALVQKGQMCSLPSTLISGGQSITFSTFLDNLLPRGNNQLVKSFVPKYFSEPYSSLPSPSNKMPPVVSEVVSNKQMLATTHPIDKPITHLNSQMQNRMLGAQRLSPKQETGSNQQALPSFTGPACQNQQSIANSEICSIMLFHPGEQVPFSSSTGTTESMNSLSNSLEDIKRLSLVAKSKLCNESNYINSVVSLPCGTTRGTTSCGDLPINVAPPSWYQQNDSDSSLSISQVPKASQDIYINKGSLAESEKGILKKEDDLAQASCDRFSESDVLHSCSPLLPGTFQKHGCSRSNSNQSDHKLQTVVYEANDTCHPIANRQNVDMKEQKLLQTSNCNTSLVPFETLGSDFFDLLGLDYMTNFLNGGLDDVLVHPNAANCCKLSTDTSKTPSNLNACPAFDSLSNEVSCSGVFSVTDSDQLLDAMISKVSSGAKQDSDYSACKTSISNICSHYSDSANEVKLASTNFRQDQTLGLPSVIVKTEAACSSYGKSSCSYAEVEDYPQETAPNKSQIRLWVESGQNLYNDSMSVVNNRKVAEGGKMNRKRPRPGENPRPRPKDRQMIQDRVKELREIVPNGAKCSIDALLEKTIKHMLFLQSVTKHADKLKDTGEPKISNEEGGFLLKDNFEGGATWAFEVGTQTMMCPIIVEDLNPPRQLLVEMLCEERGFFLEIADFIRGLGLTILKGVMEARKNKVWARFAVEANRDVTRMEIFLSLVRLLEPQAASSIAPRNVGNINMPHTMFHQNSVPVTGLSNHPD